MDKKSKNTVRNKNFTIENPKKLSIFFFSISPLRNVQKQYLSLNFYDLIQLIASFQPIRNECVQVIVRCRPISNKEKASNFQQVVDVYPNRGVIEIVNPSEPSKENKKMFTYDAVYNEVGSQQMIYDEVVRPLVSSVLEGFNGCVFGELN
jgi:Kinesin motor domain